MSVMNYVEFTISFFVIFSLFINILLLIAAVFKSKLYSIELVLLGMISFCILWGFHEFLQLTVTSYKIAGISSSESSRIISEMFSLMASMLVFGVGVTKNRLQDFRLGYKK